MKKVSRGRGRQWDERAELEEFDLVDVCDICYASDEELYRALHALTRVRDAGVETGADTRPVEIEICYVRRELRCRDDRREAHDNYVRRLQEENAVLGQAVIMVTPTEAN